MAKKAKEYITPALAAARLISQGVDLIARGRRGMTVHWELKLSFQYSKDYKRWPGQLALPMGGTLTSGPEWDEDVELAKAQAKLDAKGPETEDEEE